MHCYALQAKIRSCPYNRALIFNRESVVARNGALFQHTLIQVPECQTYPSQSLRLEFAPHRRIQSLARGVSVTSWLST
jgi:hypothetical protein